MWSDVLEPRVTAVEGRVIIDTSFLRELKQITDETERDETETDETETEETTKTDETDQAKTG